MSKLAILAILSSGAIALISLASRQHHIRNIHNASIARNAILRFSPTHLSGIDIVFIIILIIFKYLAKLVGLHPSLPASLVDEQTFDLPELTLSAPLIVDAPYMKRFRDAVFDINSADKASNEGVHSQALVVAATEPMMLLLLANRKCPILPLGSVKTTNRFEFLDPRACRNLLDMDSLVVTGLFGGSGLKGRRVKRGMEFDIVVELRKSGTRDVDQESLIFRQYITILAFLPKTTKPLFVAGIAESSPTRTEFQTLTRPIHIAMSAPSLWSAVCNDYNPIHISSLAAKAFGFPGKIAHGNHVIAYMMEQQQEGAAGELWWVNEKPSFLQVSFKRPMVVPLELEVRVAEGGKNEMVFEIFRGDKVHVAGSTGTI